MNICEHMPACGQCRYLIKTKVIKSKGVIPNSEFSVDAQFNSETIKLNLTVKLKYIDEAEQSAPIYVCATSRVIVYSVYIQV